MSKLSSFPKPLIIVVLVSIMVVVGLANILDIRTNTKTVITKEGNQFSQLYPGVNQANNFIFASDEDIVELFSSGTGLIFLGFPECPWCQKLAPIIDEAARAEGLKKIYYYNIREGRNSNSLTYQELVKKLAPFLKKDEAGKPRIYVPDLTAVKDGKVVSRFEMEEATDEELKNSDLFWTELRHQNAVNQIESMIRSL